MANKISGIILAKNEEKRIERCLDSLKWCNEIIVIDDNSCDNTVKIAEDRGVKVFRRDLADDFASQRNFGLEKANNKWVLFVDADEIVSSSLAKEIVRRVKKTKFNGFYLPRKEFFMGKALRFADKPSWDWSFGPICLLRLAKKDLGGWQGKVHETWQIKEPVGKLLKPLYHFSFETITAALTKINFYSSIRAKEDREKGMKASFTQIVFYPGLKFFKDLFWHLGFLDGTRGIIFCFLMALQSFLFKAKLWRLAEEA